MIKNNITVTALRLFLSRGYKYVSLVDVAHEVGITKGGIYHYFSSKEELLNAAVQFLFDHLKAKFIQLFSGEKSIREILYAIIVEHEVDHYIKEMIGSTEVFGRTNDENFKIEIMQHIPHLYKRIDSDHLDICDAIEKKLHRALQNGEIRGDVDSKIMAIIILTFLNGQKSLGIFANDSEVRKEMMENFYRLICV